MTFGRINIQTKTTSNIFINSTDPLRPKKFCGKYCYLEINEEKPCLWITEEAPFFKKRLYHSNILLKMARDLKSKLEDIEELFHSYKVKELSEEINAKLLDAIDFLTVAGNKYLDIARAYPEEYNTTLEKERMQLCLREMQEIIKNAGNIYQKDSKKRSFRKLQKDCSIIEGLAEDVQESWPDIFLWMICGKKKVACSRIPARNIIYSPIIEERGFNCGVRRTIRFYANEKNHKNLSLKLDVLSFLCADRHKHDFITGIPAGYRFAENVATLPRKLIAETKYQPKFNINVDNEIISNASREYI
ncbi:hypothetical protein JTB14_035469 [Gonioctena quinquepunctata]|nr:hypothetical protein JTB14_035469 [Gonioctena quinquepunctata]